MDERGRSLYDDARYYDLVMGRYATGPVLDFYRRQVVRYGEPVLELACGTGRITIPLAQAGTNITGLDISKHMLGQAEQKSFERGLNIPFVEGDIRNFNLSQKFKLIFIAAQSLTHLHILQDIEKCFACVRRHLAKGGRFLIEMHNPSIQLLNREPGHRYSVGDYEDYETQKLITLTEEVRYDAASQVNHITWYFRGEVDQHERELSFEMRQFFPQEFDALLMYNDFLIEQKYGDYDESTFASASPKQLIVCSARDEI